MKRGFTLVVAVSLLFGVRAYGQTSQQRGSQTDDSFLSRAMEMNQAEIDISRTALEKTQNPRVKEYAEMMVQDHTQALDKLRNEAGGGQTQVQLSKQHQQLRDRLSGLTGTQFDTEYMNAMVRDHQQAVQMFEKETNSTDTGASQRQKPDSDTDTDAQIAREMLPTLQKHLKQAQQFQRDLGSNTGKNPKY
jgi:putative membrane protein